jgi:phage portal protein BeeE
LLYKPRNVRPNKIYGYSPVEQILMTINIGLRRQLMQLQHFTDGNVPPGIMGMPDLSPQQVAQFQQFWNDMLSGNTAERTRMQMVPWAAKWQAFKEPPLKDEFDEWLARVVMFRFR